MFDHRHVDGKYDIVVTNSNKYCAQIEPMDDG